LAETLGVHEEGWTRLIEGGAFLPWLSRECLVNESWTHTLAEWAHLAGNRAPAELAEWLATQGLALQQDVVVKSGTMLALEAGQPVLRSGIVTSAVGFTPPSAKDVLKDVAGLDMQLAGLSQSMSVDTPKAAAAKAETDEAMAKKNAAETQVAELTATLNKLITKLNEAEATKAAAEATVERGLAKASLANRLTNALADENVRWAASIETLTAEQEMLIGDVLLASSFIS
jgi:hypothetical protein